MPFHLYLLYGCFLPTMTEMSCGERDYGACLKYLPSRPLLKEFVDPWSGCSWFRRRVIVHERIKGKNGPLQGLVESEQPGRSREDILGGRNDSKGKNTEEKNQRCCLRDRRRTMWVGWPVSFQSSQQEGWSSGRKVGQQNVGFPKPRRKWICEKWKSRRSKEDPVYHSAE